MSDLAIGVITPPRMAVAEVKQVNPTILQILEETGIGLFWCLTAARLLGVRVGELMVWSCFAHTLSSVPNT